MLRSYLQLHVVCDCTYATNEKFSCGSHLQLIFSHKLKLQNGVFLVVFPYMPKMKNVIVFKLDNTHYNRFLV
jgi:hypothetical protein